MNALQTDLKTVFAERLQTRRLHATINCAGAVGCQQSIRLSGSSFERNDLLAACLTQREKAI
jgi:hypothetical protein